MNRLLSRAAALLKSSLPGRRPRWKYQEGVYTWAEGYRWGIGSPPETLAIQYFNFKLLQALVSGRRYRRSLEVGCGWGARSPWIAEFSAEAHAVEPNPEVLRAAKECYPTIKFENARAQQLPYPDDFFDLIVTWTVLQHIPPDQIDTAAAEILRVLSPGGTLLLFESLRGGRARPPVWDRDEPDYERLFSPLRIVESLSRSEVSGRAEDKKLIRLEEVPREGGNATAAVSRS